MAIQRWDFDVWSGCEEEDSEGEFVKLADHLSDKATALREQREGMIKMFQRHICDSWPTKMIVEYIRAYAVEGEESP